MTEQQILDLAQETYRAFTGVERYDVQTIAESIRKVLRRSSPKYVFDTRPLPDYWRVGQKVRFLRNADWTWSKGQIATITSLRDTGVPAAQYQVFYTKPLSGSGHWWTTPDDVELAEEAE